jgi:hypothetical protein
MSSRRLFFFVLTVLPMGLALGCGGVGRPVPVSGKVEWEDGTPVSGVTVTFWPKKQGEGVLTASGYTGKDGTFELTTHNPGDGALPGEYAILVVKVQTPVETPSSPDGSSPDPKDNLRKMREWQEKNKNRPKAGKEIPAVYSKAESTPLKATISGSTSDIKLKLQKL